MSQPTVRQESPERMRGKAATASPLRAPMHLSVARPRFLRWPPFASPLPASSPSPSITITCHLSLVSSMGGLFAEFRAQASSINNKVMTVQVLCKTLAFGLDRHGMFPRGIGGTSIMSEEEKEERADKSCRSLTGNRPGRSSRSVVKNTHCKHFPSPAHLRVDAKQTSGRAEQHPTWHQSGPWT
ncbi:unnamed protein product [Pleuronectes platessa]|uniref:Uncharacterized protein n=1 Tax=Pleuronectes platessa TaxID=8262 RepID=A0A9N7Z1I0_PLEPL|nr:unnamed protein product [Pleuronectes platessa]